MGVMAQYYGLPWLSYRAVAWHEQQRGQPGFSLPETMLEGGRDIHPNERGHGCGTGTQNPPSFPLDRANHINVLYWMDDKACPQRVLFGYIGPGPNCEWGTGDSDEVQRCEVARPPNLQMQFLGSRSRNSGFKEWSTA